MLSVLLTRRNESLLTAADKQSGAYVLDYAVAPLYPAGPSRKKALALGWAAAVAAGVSIGLLRELIDRRVRDPDTIARTLGVQTIGLIPQVEDRSTLPEHQAGRARQGPAAEGYRNLRTSILFAMRENKLYILEGTVPAGYPEPGFFQQSVRWLDENGNGVRYQTLYHNGFPKPPVTVSPN